MEKGVPIRSVARSLTVLQAINRARSMTLMQIAREASLPYPTTCRVVQTLLHEGMIEREPGTKRYRPSPLVQTLSHGFNDDSRLVTAAQPLIEDFTRKAGWPVSLTSHLGDQMIVRASTHMLTTLTFNRYDPGYAFPILECAAGHAYLSFLPERSRTDILSNLRKYRRNEQSLPLLLLEGDSFFEKVQANGYAVMARSQHNQNPGKTSSIAVPILHRGAVLGCLTLIFFASSMTMQAAIERFAEPLKQLGADIARRVEEGEPAYEDEDEDDPLVEA